MGIGTVLEESDVLLVVDVQNDFCPGGALAVNEGDLVVPSVNRLGRMLPHVILTQDWHTEGHFSFASSHEGKSPFETVTAEYGEQTLWPAHCVQGSIGAEFHKGLDLPMAELIVRKGFHRDIDSYSAFYENDRRTPTGLHGYMKERKLKRIFIAGLATDFCVKYSALDGRRLGYAVFLIREACRGIDIKGSVATAMREMEGAGVAMISENDISAIA